MKINISRRSSSRSFYCFVESFLYTSIVYFVFFYMSPFKHGFLELNLHPLLVVVALISLRYGTHLSSFAVSFATFFYFLAYLNIERDPILFFASFEYYKFILMFFFTALLVGKLRDTTDEKIIHMENEMGRLRKGYNRQKRNNIKMTFTNNRLKKQIINSKESVITLHHITSSLEEMGVEEIFTKALLNIKQFIDCDVISIYTYNDKKKFARLKTSVGKGRMPTYFQVEKGSPHHEVLTTGTALEFPLDIEGNTPVYIAPVLNGRDTVGFINIERLSFEAQERYSFEMFKIISYWLNRALGKAILKETEEMKMNSYEGTRIFRMEYFNRRLEEEITRKKLFDQNYIAFEGRIGDVSPSEAEVLLKGRIRREDVVGMDRGLIRFIFPATEDDNKGLLLAKLRGAFEGIDFYEI